MPRLNQPRKIEALFQRSRRALGEARMRPPGRDFGAVGAESGTF